MGTRIRGHSVQCWGSEVQSKQGLKAPLLGTAGLSTIA